MDLTMEGLKGASLCAVADVKRIAAHIAEFERRQCTARPSPRRSTDASPTSTRRTVCCRAVGGLARRRRSSIGGEHYSGVRASTGAGTGAGGGAVDVGVAFADGHAAGSLLKIKTRRKP